MVQRRYSVGDVATWTREEEVAGREEGRLERKTGSVQKFEVIFFCWFSHYVYERQQIRVNAVDRALKFQFSISCNDFHKYIQINYGYT